MTRLTNNPLQALDTVFAELFNYLATYEQDRCTGFMNDLARNSNHQWTMAEAFSQFRILLGGERYEQVTLEWSRARERRMK